MLVSREESRVLLHALSDLDECGKLDGVDLSSLGEIPESVIHVEHREYLEEFAPAHRGGEQRHGRASLDQARRIADQWRSTATSSAASADLPPVIDARPGPSPGPVPRRPGR